MSYNVVFHVDFDDEKCVNIALTNILNFYASPQSQDAQVVLVVNGPAIKLFTKDSVFPDLATAIEKGASVRVCQNAVTKFGIEPENLADNLTIIPAAIVELIDLQNAGFAYIKP